MAGGDKQEPADRPRGQQPRGKSPEGATERGHDRPPEEGKEEEEGERRGSKAEQPIQGQRDQHQTDAQSHAEACIPFFFLKKEILPATVLRSRNIQDGPVVLLGKFRATKDMWPGQHATS